MRAPGRSQALIPDPFKGEGSPVSPRRPRLTLRRRAAAPAAASLSANAAFEITVDTSGDVAYQSRFCAAETFWVSVITG